MTQRTASRLAWSMWATTVALVVATVALIVSNVGDRDVLFNVLGLLMVMGYGTVGALIASRQHGNAIGWLFLLIGLSFALAAFSEDYLTRAVRIDPGSLPAVPLMASVQTWAFILAFAPIPLVLLLFPTGRLPSRRWRPVAWAMIAAPAIGIVGFMIDPAPLGGNVKVPNPTGVEGLRGLAHVLLTIAGIGSITTALACIVALVLRFRRARGEERQQIRWLAYAGAAAGLLLLATFLTEGVVGEDSAVAEAVFIAFFVTLALGIPAASGIAILKYRLYEIDIVIRKTLVFAVLAAFITLVYLGIVIGVPALLFGVGGRANALPLIAAIVVALAFQPLRERARHLANRLVYGKRATPYEVLSEFSDRMAGTYSVEDVLPRMARIIAAGTGAKLATVWLRVGSELRPAASWPTDGEGPLASLSISGTDVPAIPAVDKAIAVRDRGELLGAIAVAMPANEPMSPAQEKLLEDLASQATLVLRNVSLIEELRASRQRIITAQDEERRRLERNIHDGAQQQLVALAIRLRLARALAKRDPDKADETLGQLEAEAQEALENLRDLARGIYPPLLQDQGLAAALEAQARKAPVRTTVSADGISRYRQDAEAAVYFCCLEALQNVAKYAGASHAEVRLGQENGELLFSVTDDGRGFDPDTTAKGSGLQNMEDRLAAIGGRIEITSTPGVGTTVIGRVPVQPVEPAA